MNTELSFDDVDLRPVEVEVLKRMRDVVAQKGEDYIYRLEDRLDENGDLVTTGVSCAYYDLYQDSVTEQTEFVPSCVVGHVFDALGLTEIFRLWGEEGGVDSAVEAMRRSDNDLVEQIDDSPELISALNKAQVYQDKGLPWGLALQAFEYTLHNKVMIREDRERMARD